MKRTTLLSLAGIMGAAALVISQLGAADPNPTSPPEESPTAKGPLPPGDPQKFCGSDQFGGAGDRSHGPGRHWGRHRDEEQMLDRLLNLTEEQKEKVKEIMQASRPNSSPMRPDM